MVTRRSLLVGAAALGALPAASMVVSAGAPEDRTFESVPIGSDGARRVVIAHYDGKAWWSVDGGPMQEWPHDGSICF